MLEIHLDLVGGLAGDMFIAALLDAFPHFESRVLRSIDTVCADEGVSCSLEPFHDSILSGRCFKVRAHDVNVTRGPFAAMDGHEPHTSWKSIRARLTSCGLPDGVRQHALAIFGLLAEAEAHVHGVEADAVKFHEVGAWDSLADIVGAAALIDAVAATRWTTSAAPLGSGRVRTAHGELPVPAPATVHLLLGMLTIDDGVAGERITPTGAAILRHLCPPTAGHGIAEVRRLRASGMGFGSRRLAGLSNHVRALCFEPADHIRGGQRAMHVLEFEVDDQSGEDLATGLERLRAHPAVLDVVQSPVFGKKGRIMMHVRVLARASVWEDAAQACFRETTTIGLRHQVVHGMGLDRRIEVVTIDGHELRVKVVDRPGGVTAKAEADDVAGLDRHAPRAALRGRAETAVLDGMALRDA